MRRSGPTALILALLAPLAALGQTASLVRDINLEQSPENSAAGVPEAALGKVFFGAREPSTGGELWVTDGTDSGTRLLRDVCPGPCTSHPNILGSLPGALLWTTGIFSGNRLWRTDGTRAGTFALSGPELGIAVADLSDLEGERTHLFLGSHFYFAGCAIAQDECGLWKTDGTASGTRAVASTGGFTRLLTAFGSRLAFRGGDGLWISDGTPQGTSMVKDFDIWSIERIEVAAGKIFLVINASGQGEELWVSDGTGAGTRFLKKLTTETGIDHQLKAGANGVYFSVGGDFGEETGLWFSDGTPGGTRLVSHHGSDVLEEVGGRLVLLRPDSLVAATADPNHLQELMGGPVLLEPWLFKAGSRILFSASHGFSRELWSTDGTPAGTQRIQHLCSGPCPGMAGRPSPWPGGILFVATDDQNGPELWTSDGTPQGTRRLTGLPDPYEPSSPRAARLGDELFFAASSPYGFELWASRSPADTRLVTHIAGDGAGSDPDDLLALGDRLFFTACDGFERTVWQSTGETEGAASVGPATGSGSCVFNEEPNELAAAGGQVYLRKENGELWRTDGTAAGTRQLATSVNTGIVPLQGSLFFIIWLPGQVELWKTDGSATGTVQVLGLPVNEPQALGAAGSELYFAGRDAEGNSQIWRSDGTPAGTRRIATLEGSFRHGSFPVFVRAGSRVYFVDGLGQIWRTDGTEAGTARLESAGGAYFTATRLTGLNGLLYFFATREGQRGLWRSDGTAAGTIPVRLFAQDPDSDSLSSLFSAAGRLFFDADDGIHGVELWASDGTLAGTVLVQDIFPGPESSLPQGFTAAGGKVFFAARDSIHGSELWQTDGTGAGTRMVQDIAPLLHSSSPGNLTSAGNRLYFTADDGVSGRELWALPLDETGCHPSPRHLCLGNGRYRVEATWKDFQGNTGRGTAVAVTGDTGYFWFFSPTNVEVILKVLDGTGLNGHRWVFYGALSSVEYTLTVTDTQTGLTRRYFNPMGQLASVGDVTGFGPLGAFSVARPSPAVLPEERIVATAGSCQPTAERLCLNNQRFAVEVAWKDFQGNQGTGKAVNLTADTGYFWFFDAANVEVVLKVLDGTGLNGKHWVFYGALSSVEYTITVTDTQTGAQKTYKNPSGRLASVADVEAF